MKRSKSALLAFSLAAATTLGVAGTASAQSAGVAGPAPQPTNVAVQPAVTPAPQLSIDDVYNFAYNVGVQTAYPLAGRGFAQGTLPSGQHVGIEFNLTTAPNGQSNYSVRSTYNLDNPRDSASFQGAVNSAAATQQSRELGGAIVTYPPAYVLVPPPVAVVGVGFGVYGWNPYWVHRPVIWEGPGFGYRGGFGIVVGFDHGVRRDFHERPVIIERGHEGFHGHPAPRPHGHR